MKKCIFVTLLVLMALTSCSKPENEDELLLKNNDPIEAMAMLAKDLPASIPAEIKGISDTCNSKTYALMAGKTTNVGTVVVSNDLNFLYVTYNTTGDWDLSEVQLYVRDSEPMERLTPGAAPYKSGTLPAGTTSYTFTIPFGESLECGSLIWLQAHASVDTETAYGGTIVPKPEEGSWYGNISYIIECCEQEEECDLSASAIATAVKCFGASTGKIDLTVKGGTAPFTFVWSNGAATEDLENIPAGEYSVNVYDAHQCLAAVEEIMVLQPASGISANAVVTDISEFGAHDGAIDVTVNGGTPPYTYLWNNEAVTQDLTGLGPGTYSVVITDANGCNTALRALLVEEPDEEKPEGIAAFARKTWEPMVKCFMDYGFESFGWTNGALAPDETFESNYELFANVEGCGISGATKVGLMKLHYFNGTATATINLLPGYTMSKSALYLGNNMFPKVGEVNTIDPANYPYKHDLSGATSDSFTVNGLSGNIYIIGYVLLDPEAN